MALLTEYFKTLACLLHSLRLWSEHASLISSGLEELKHSSTLAWILHVLWFLIVRASSKSPFALSLSRDCQRVIALEV